MKATALFGFIDLSVMGWLILEIKVSCVTAHFVALLDVDGFRSRERPGYFAPCLGMSARRRLRGSYETWCDGVRLRYVICHLASRPKTYLHLLIGSHYIGSSAPGSILHRVSAHELGGFDESFVYRENFDF